MADENIQEVEQMEEPQGEAKNETDWKAEARKWEARAKKSIAAEEELAALKQAQMTEQEKATARAEKAEAELAEYKAEAERHNAAREIAESEGVPLGLLEYCADADAMKRFAAEYKACQVPVHAAASVDKTRVVKGEGKASTRTQFAQFVSANLDKQ